MDIVQKVGHKILCKGDILKSPSGGKDWVVVKTTTSSDPTIKIASIQKYMNKPEKELEEWFIKKQQD